MICIEGVAIDTVDLPVESSRALCSGMDGFFLAVVLMVAGVLMSL